MKHDRIALQLLMTGGLTSIRREFEQLHSTADLDSWLRTVIGSDHRTKAASEDLECAIELREAIFLVIRASTRGQPPLRAHLELINTVGAQPPLTPLLEPDGKTQGWQRPICLQAVLATIARDAIELLTGPTADRVRECANPLCELVVVDLSPPGARRWCAMNRCGNRSKTKAYRARQRPSHSRDRTPGE